MSGWQEGKVNASDVKMADFFADSWTNFAKYGKPTLDDTWQPATSTLNNMEYLEIGSNLTMKTGYRVLDQIQFNRVLPIFIGEYPQDLQDYNNGSIIGCPTGWTKSSTNSKRCYNVFNISLSQKAGLDVCLFSLASVISIDNAFENSEIQGLSKPESEIGPGTHF
uniref:Carboxylesterase type B domain-containing protein n=1 Tax=Acrobeloides nanus TaxID=290746 RepID=A0A914EC10_9BILA